MTLEANKAVLRRYKVDILNSRDINALNEWSRRTIWITPRSLVKHRALRA